MSEKPELAATAALFRALGSESRLEILRLLATAPSTVGMLVTETGMSQPLVSQHLRTLRLGGIVSAERTGRKANYALADDHIAHVIEDALAHSLENQPRGDHPHKDHPHREK